MADHSVPPVNRVEPGVAAVVQPAVPAHAAEGPQAVREVAAAAAQNRAGEKPARQALEEKLAAGKNSLAEVRLQFKVNPDTHEVTVLILDRTSNKLIRTIPSEELRKLREGELIQIST